MLIDEIDQAPRDFPNDLLRELDQHSFPHSFEQRQIVKPASGRLPNLTVTSNEERRLSVAARPSAQCKVQQSLAAMAKLLSGVHRVAAGPLAIAGSAHRSSPHRRVRLPGDAGQNSKT